MIQDYRVKRSCDLIFNSSSLEKLSFKYYKTDHREPINSMDFNTPLGTPNLSSLIFWNDAVGFSIAKIPIKFCFPLKIVRVH